MSKCPQPRQKFATDGLVLPQDWQFIYCSLFVRETLLPVSLCLESKGQQMVKASAMIRTSIGRINSIEIKRTSYSRLNLLDQRRRSGDESQLDYSYRCATTLTRLTLMPEVLHRGLVLFGFFSSIERAQVFSFARLGILLTRVEPVFTRLQFSDHSANPYQISQQQ